jgi:hypothetical protein
MHLVYRAMAGRVMPRGAARPFSDLSLLLGLEDIIGVFVNVWKSTSSTAR